MRTIYLFSILLFACLLIPSDQYKIQLTPSILTENMKSFLRYIITQHYNEKTGFLLILYNKVDIDYVDFAAKLICLESSIVIINLDTTRRFNLDAHDFLVILGDPRASVNEAEMFYETVRSTRRKNIIILTHTIHVVSVSFIFQSFWQRKVLHSAVAYEKNNAMQVYISNPFINKDVIVENVTDTYRNMNIYYDKTKNLNGYKINVLLTTSNKTSSSGINSARMFSGGDYMVATTIYKKLNARLFIQSYDNLNNTPEHNPWSITNSAANKSQIQEDIALDNDIDMLIPSQMFNPHFKEFENAYPHDDNGLYVMVSKASRYELIDGMVDAFFPDLFLFFLLTPLVLGTISIIFVKLTGTSTTTVPLYLNFYTSTLMNTIKLAGNDTFTKAILGGWLVVCTLINLAVQFKTTSILTTTSYAQDVNSINDLLKVNPQIYTFDAYKSDVEIKYTGTDYSKFARSFKLINSEENDRHKEVYFDLDTFDTDSGFIFEKIVTTRLRRLRKYRKNGRAKYHMMRESILPSLQSFQFVSGSPFVPAFNQVLARLKEAGLVAHWENQISYEYILKGISYPFEDYDDSSHNPQPMTFEVLKPFFVYVLLNGCIVSAVVLAMEKIIFCFNTEHSN